MQEEITLKELYQIVKKHFLTIVIAILIGAVLSVVFMTFFVTPKYKSEAQLLVSQESESAQTQILTSEIQGNVLLINTYQDIIKGHSTLEKVNKNLNTNYSILKLEKAINVSQSNNSQAFNISVTMETAEEAQRLLTELMKVFEETIRGVNAFNAASVLVLSPPSYNPNKVSPSGTLFLLGGTILGFIISMFIITFMELIDTSVKEDEFLIQLGLINLGHIYELSTKELKETRLTNKNNLNRLRERI